MEYIEQLSNLNDILNEFLMNAGYLAPILSSLLIILEGIFAFLPLFIFVTINILTLGPLFGGIISWLLTTLGSFLSFYLFRMGFSSFFQRKISNKNKLRNFMQRINKLKFRQLVLIIAIPFAPSFFINLAAGLSKLSLKKYLYALLIGKIFVIIFLGYIGSSLIECLTNPVIFIKIVCLVLGAYIIARIVNKKFDLDGRF